MLLMNGSLHNQQAISLVKVQNILETQSNEGARRLRESQIDFIATRRNRSSSTQSSPDSFHEGQASDQQDSDRHSSVTERITPSEGHSFAETAIFEAGCGEMMLREQVSRGLLIRNCSWTWNSGGLDYGYPVLAGVTDV